MHTARALPHSSQAQTLMWSCHLALPPLPPSKVVLEPLPPTVAAAMQAHDEESLRIFVDYVRCFVAQLGDQTEALPLSGLTFPLPGESARASFCTGQRAHCGHLASTSLQATVTRSGQPTLCRPAACLHC